MIIMKFGGTSVGSSDRMKEMLKLVNNSTPKIVVLSAMSGTTNTLVEISKQLGTKNKQGATDVINEMNGKYKKTVEDLFTTEAYKKKAHAFIEEHFKFLHSFSADNFTITEEHTILAEGELISTGLVQLHCEEIGLKTILLPALNFMRTDRNNEPDSYYIKEQLNRELEKHPDNILFITQGYICRNAFGEIDNLKRGGSDYSASLIGAAIKAEEIQIWTDIDGFHNNDPRVVDNTKSIKYLSFDEAAELAYFGAKILHPATVWPAQESNIPVRLKNTLDPSAFGTLISDKSEGEGIKAIAAKDDITAIKIKSARMLMQYGFLRRVFEVFESYRTPIDMITTSEIAVSLTIDDISSLDKISYELRNYGKVEVDKNMTIICIVGHNIMNTKDSVSKIFEALNEVPVRMVSYGGSRHNISILTERAYKEKALKLLSKYLF